MKTRAALTRDRADPEFSVANRTPRSLRDWGAADCAYTPGGRLKEFKGHLTLNTSKDGLGLHMIAVDSKGNIDTGEVWNGERVQRFAPVR